MVYDALAPSAPLWYRFPFRSVESVCHSSSPSSSVEWNVQLICSDQSGPSVQAQFCKYLGHSPDPPLCKSKADTPNRLQHCCPQSPHHHYCSTRAKTSPVALFSLHSSPWGPLKSNSLLSFWCLDRQALKSPFLKCGERFQQSHHEAP